MCTIAESALVHYFPLHCIGDILTSLTMLIAVPGGAFFNHLSNPDGSLAMPNEGPSLDSCLGHSAPIMGGGTGSSKFILVERLFEPSIA